MRSFLLGICLMFIGLSVFALDLVENGKATGEFIIPENVHKAELWAVTDIRYWIHEMTGVYVPILTQPSDTKNTKVFVGQEFAGRFKKDIKALGTTDGYAIRSKGRNVYVFGTRPRGTFFGVFGLLERNSDIIWARPNRRFGTVFGKTENLQLNNIDVIDIPVFRVRNQTGNFRPYHQDTIDWKLRNLSNQAIGPSMYLDMVTHHHDVPYWLLARTLKDKKYMESDPEIFAYVDQYKKRMPNGVCYMNPKLVDIYFKEMIEQLNKHEEQIGRKVDYINSHMGDSWQCCECDLCMAPIQLADGSMLKPTDPSSYKDLEFRSTQYYMFYSQIMKRLKVERPDLKLYVLAYIYSAAVPKIPPDPDLLIGFCPYPTSNMHFPMEDPRQPETWRNRFINWMEITQRLSMREYYNASTIAPISLTSQQDLLDFMNKQDKDNIVISTETLDDIQRGDSGWDLAAMEMWIINRLFWDPTQNMEELRKQFIERTYREAAPSMTRYYDLVRNSWLEPDDMTVMGWHVSNQYIYENLIVKKGLEKECHQYLQDALETVKNPNSRIMIERLYNNLRGVNQDLGKLIVSNIPEMFQDGQTFESVQWEKPLVMSEFKKPYLYKVPNYPSQGTDIRAGHDGKNIYIRFDASDSNISEIDVAEPSEDEVFLKGDHIEFWLYQGRDSYLFSFDANGNKYDSKNLNKEWDSNWKLNTLKTESGWSAIITLPLKDFGLASGEKTSLKWTALRERKQKGMSPETNIYKGMSLGYRKYPIIIN